MAAAGLLLALVAPAPAAAVSSQTWRQRERAEFEKGEPKGVALGADGALRLSPRLDVLFESSQPYIWALAQDAKGVVYAAGGNDGAVERVSASGRPEVVFRAPEPEVHALAVDASGHLYLGTAPGGAIYKIDEKGRTIWRCETGEEYVWALLFDRQGVLHAGTGPEGRILKVDGQGRAEVLFDSAETHIRTLALDRDGRLLAGTDGHGLLFRISPKGEGFVLYDAPLNEIAALAVSPEGTIYAAVLGETGRGVPRAGPPPAAPAQAAPTPAPGADAAPQPSPTPAPEQAPPISEQRVPISMEGKLLAISPEGYAREIWSGAQEAILSLAFTASGRLILGSSQKGRIYALDSGGEISEIARAPSTQVTALLPLVRPVAGQAAAEARKGRKGGAGAAPGDVAAAGSNFGSLSVLRAGHVASGSFESRVFDARSFATWGRLSWRAEMPRGTSVAVSARSGNTEEPDRTWSDWGPALGEPGGSALDRPPARFLQWRAVLTTEDPGRTPVLREVAVTYLQRNLPPEIRKVEVHPPGVAFQKVPASASAGAPEARPSGSAGAEVEGGARRRAKPQSRRGFEAGFRSVTWQAADANDDDLVFDVHYRAVDETTWKPMRSAIDEDFVSWDGAAMPDGTYVVRVIASDAPSNAPGLALTAERVSEQFDVDTTPPRVEDLRVQAGSASLRLSFTVTDTFSIVRDVACSVDAGDWVVLFPADGLADAPSERFDAVLPALPPGEHSIVVRATDSAGNTGAGRVLVTIP